MDKKYELTNEKIEVDGLILYRIMALRDFKNVKTGEIGGYIEKEKNLSHYDNAWIYGSAQVSGNALVNGSAWIYGYAQVSGDAQVSGNALVNGSARVYSNAQVGGSAWIYGNAQVSGNAQVYGDAWYRSPLQIQGTKHFFCQCTKDKIKIGCIVATIDEWKKEYKQVCKENGYTDDEIAEYGRYINLL